MTIESKSTDKETVLALIRLMIDSEKGGRITFEKDREGISVSATSDVEPTS